jgi:hypothetical protein
MEDFSRLLFFLGDKRNERHRSIITRSLPEKFHAIPMQFNFSERLPVKSVILVDLIGSVLFDLMRLQFSSARYTAPRTITRFVRPEYIEET